MDWSYDLLDESERTLFMRLCVFVGEFTLDAAEAVMPRASGEPDTVHLLVRLVTKSIVSVAEGPGGADRYRLLETLRQYGLERLAASGDEDLIRARHARYYAGVAEEAERNIHGPSGAAWLERVERELPNLREAFTWSFGHDELELGVRLTGALRWFFGSMGNLAEARGWLELVLSRREELSPDLLLIAVTASAMLAWSQGDHTNTAVLGEEGVRLAEALDDRQQLANALIVRGAVAVYEGNPERATECFERAQGLCEELGDRWANAWLLTCWAVASRRTGSLDLAAQQLERALGIFRSLHDERGQVLPLVNLALLAQQQARLDRAVELATEAVTVATSIKDRQSVHFAVCILGRIELDRGDLDRSRDLLIRGLAAFRGAEHALLVAIALEGMAMICARRGRQGDAVSLWAFAGEVRRRSALPLSDERRRERDAELAVARQVLSEQAYEQAEAIGRSLTQAEAMDLAVEATGVPGGPEQARETSGATS
jgi:tetratricopeptide (TPR) repeat protein